MSRTEPFTQNIERYEQWFLHRRFAYVSELKAVQSLSPHSGVEIGVGTGRFAAPLKVRYDVEPSAAMAALARKRGVEVTPGSLLGRSCLERKEQSFFCWEVTCFSTAEVVTLMEQAGFHDFAFAQTLFRPPREDRGGGAGSARAR